MIEELQRAMLHEVVQQTRMWEVALFKMSCESIASMAGCSNYILVPIRTVLINQENGLTASKNHAPITLCDCASLPVSQHHTRMRGYSHRSSLSSVPSIAARSLHAM